MAKIRVSELAREIGVESNSVLKCLPSLGITNQMFPVSLLNDNQANRVRERFRRPKEVPVLSQPRNPLPDAPRANSSASFLETPSIKESSAYITSLPAQKKPTTPITANDETKLRERCPYCRVTAHPAVIRDHIRLAHAASSKKQVNMTGKETPHFTDAPGVPQPLALGGEAVPSDQLLTILARSPDDVRARWSPAATPAKPLSNEEFIHNFSRLWFRFKLEQYGCRLNPLQQSLINAKMAPNRLASQERGTLEAVIDFGVLNRLAEEYARPDSVYNLLHGLLNQIVALPLTLSLRARVWAAMLSGLSKPQLLLSLKDSVPYVINLRRLAPADAQVWEKAILALLESAGNRAHDPSLLELHKDAVKQTSPLDYLSGWLGRLEFPAQTVENRGQGMQQVKESKAEQAEAKKQEEPVPTSAGIQSENPVPTVETTDIETGPNKWVLSRYVADVPALEIMIGGITERLSRLKDDLPVTGTVRRALELGKALRSLGTELPKWLESLPDPEIIASELTEATEVYQQAQKILGTETDAIVSKASPRDLRDALPLLRSCERLAALPEWVWNLDGAAPVLDAVSPIGKWAETLIAPEIRERATSVLDVLDEEGGENGPFLRFIPAPEVNGDAKPNTAELKEHVRRSLQSFRNVLLALPSEMQGQLASSSDYKRVMYCVDRFTEWKQRLSPETSNKVLASLWQAENVSTQAQSYEKAIDVLESVGVKASTILFDQITDVVQKDDLAHAGVREAERTPQLIWIDHNWVDHPRRKAPAVYFSDPPHPYGWVSVPMSIRTMQNRQWSLGLSVQVRSGHRDPWGRDWPEITPCKLDVRETDWRKDAQTDEWVYSFGLRIPVRRDNQGRGPIFKFDITMFDWQGTGTLGKQKPFDWDTIDEAPASLRPNWPPYVIDPRHVAEHPIGPQCDHEEILSELRKSVSFAVMAPRRFGKSTLVEYLSSKLQAQGFVTCVKNCLTGEYYSSNSVDYDRFWSDVSDELQKKVGAAIEKSFQSGLPSETAFDDIRCAARSKRMNGIVILIDEAQIFFAGQNGTVLGDTLKDRLERHWSRPDDGGLVPVTVGLVGLPSLRERAGANLCGSLFRATREDLNEQELNRLILDATGQNLHTTRDARERLRSSAQNLFMLRSLVGRLANSAFADQRTWINRRDVLDIEKELKRELEQGEAKDLADYVRDALNDGETIDKFVPKPAVALAIALASAVRDNVSPPNFREYAKRQLESWCEPFAAGTSCRRLVYNDQQFGIHLQSLEEHGIIRNFGFRSELLEAWVAGLTRLRYTNPGLWGEIMIKAAIPRIKTEALKPLDCLEGAQAKVWPCLIDGDKCAVRKTKLETEADRQLFIQEKDILEKLKEQSSKGKPGREFVFTVKDVGLSSENESEAVLVYHWIEGCDLSQKEGQLSGPFVAALGVKLARALRYLKDAGILHRDLRPQNIILSEDYDPIIIDFGFARRIAAGGGTPFYDSFAAQEVQVETPDWTPKADVYGLGATLRFILAPGPTNGSLLSLLEQCCSSKTDRPDPPELCDRFQQVAIELGVETEKVNFSKQINALSRDDWGRPGYKRVLDKCQPKFQALKLGCCINPLDRACEVADFLNQAVEALSDGQFSLCRGKEFQQRMPAELRTDELKSVGQLRNSGAHGGGRKSVLTNKNEAEVRELVKAGAAQIARLFSVPSITRVVEAVL